MKLQIILSGEKKLQIITLEVFSLSFIKFLEY